VRPFFGVSPAQKTRIVPPPPPLPRRAKIMKRHGNLWEHVISFEALLRAAEKARKGKRFRPAVASFHFDQERALWTLHDELTTKTYRPGPYRSFIHEPKKRQISAAPYRDRVVHHALVDVLEPILERTFIADSYACRKGKGTHAAVDRCQQFARHFRSVLKADVQKFFPSLDHDICNDLVARKIKDPEVLWLVCRIVKGYVRYVDDFLIFSDDKKYLNAIREQVREFLIRLRLRLHPGKSVIFAVKEGIRFLGYRVFTTHRLLPKENVRRFRRRVRSMQDDYAVGRVAFAEVYQRLMSWIGHARQANTYRLRCRLFDTIRFQRATTD
jgi:RNA-directed DNA polymerase